MDLLGNQGWFIWLITHASEYDWLKRKRNMESTVLKCKLENIMHSTWKEYENYSLVMAK